MFEFLEPSALWTLAAVPLVYLLNMFRHRRLKVRVSSSLVWREVLEKHPGSPRSAKRFINLQLIVEILVVVLIACALAEPVLKGPEPGNWKVIVLDASCGMNAENSGGVSRFEAGKRAAEDEIRGVGQGGRAVLFVSGGVTDGARLVTVLKMGEALESLKKISASDAPSDIAEVVGSAAAFAVSENAALVVVTDKKLELPKEIEAITKRGPDFEGAGNIGITALGIRDNSALVTVSKFGEAPASAKLTVEADCGGMIFESALNFAPGDSAKEIIFSSDALSTGARFVEAKLAAITGENSLKSDDSAYAFKARRGGIRAAVIGRAPESALRALKAAARGGEIIIETSGKPEPGFDVYVYAGQLPKNGQTGAVLLLNPPEGTTGGFVFTGTVRATGGLTAPGSPLGSEVDYRIEKQFDVRTFEGDGARAVINAMLENGSQVPAAFIKRGESGTLAAVLFSPDESGWPEAATFPVFFAEIFDFVLGGGAQEWRVLKTGETYYAGSKIAGGKIAAADGKTIPVSPSDAGIFSADFAGGVELETESGVVKIGASVLNAAESNTAAVPNQSNREPKIVPKRTGEEPKELRRLFLAAAVLLILLYWFVARDRTQTGKKGGK